MIKIILNLINWFLLEAKGWRQNHKRLSIIMIRDHISILHITMWFWAKEGRLRFEFLMSYICTKKKTMDDKQEI